MNRSNDLLPANDLLPEGLEDRLPAQAAAITRAMRAALDVLDSHGYDRVRPPLIEFEESMAGRMVGVEPRKMFRFVDPNSLRTLALRSDMTVQIGRIAETSLAAAPRPLRLCYAGEVAVIKADQLDPARQRMQLGAELIGQDSVNAVAEALALAVECAKVAGGTDIQVDLTLPDLVDKLGEEAIPLDGKSARLIRQKLDAKDAGGLKAAGGEAFLPLLYAAGPFEHAIAALEEFAGLNEAAAAVLNPRITWLKQIAQRLNGTARVTLDPAEHHGFEYQSWFGFSLYAKGVRGTLGRGGTYAICGPNEATAKEPAMGFSLYLDGLVDIAAEAIPRDLLYLPFGHDTAAAAALRSSGWRTLAQLDEGEDAAALGCTHSLVNCDPVQL